MRVTLVYSLVACLLGADARVAAVAAGCPQSSAVVTALLPLHGGPDCSALQLRGLQQLAALRAAVSEVNSDMSAQDGLTLGLLVQDTCSSAEGALRAAMKSLVDLQQSCSNPPLYLGMIGPERSSEIAKVLGVTRVFDATHILPAYLQLTFLSAEDSVFFVSIEHAMSQAQNVLALMRKLNWQNYALAFEEGASGVAEALVTAGRADSAPCLKGSPHRLTPAAPVPDIFSGSQDGVVVLAETPLLAAQVLQAYQTLSTPLLLLVRTVGLEAWQVPRSATNLYLLQQVSLSPEGVPEAMNVTLKEEYERQQQTEFQDVHCKSPINAAGCAVETSAEDSMLEDIDASVAPLAHGVRLLSAALRASHRSRCLSGAVPTMGLCPQLLAMPAAEWRTSLRRATVVNSNQRLRFLTELSPKYHVYTRDTAGALVKVAVLSAGALKEVASDYTFPALQHETAAICGETPTIPPPPAPTTTNSFGDTFDNFGSALRELYSSESSFYQLMGLVVGVCFIMFAIMVAIIYVIYNSLAVKSDKESTGGSLETVRMSRPKERKARRSIRDTFRRNSSTRETNRS